MRPVWSNSFEFRVGWIDEIVVFNDILSAAEIDEIRAGTYGVSGGQLIMISKALDWEVNRFLDDFVNGRWTG